MDNSQTGEQLINKDFCKRGALGKVHGAWGQRVISDPKNNIADFLVYFSFILVYF